MSIITTEWIQYVYVVMGSTGEYSDHVEWPVRAFLLETKAQQFVEACTREHERISYARSGFWIQRRVEVDHALDPNYQCDYTGTRYYILSVEMDTDPDA